MEYIVNCTTLGKFIEDSLEELECFDNIICLDNGILVQRGEKTKFFPAERSENNNPLGPDVMSACNQNWEGMAKTLKNMPEQPILVNFSNKTASFTAEF
jgi:hypothetical protein